MDTQKKEFVGFIPPIITPDHYVFGAGQVPLDILQVDGDWTPFLPEDERQDIRNIETYNCTGFGTTNAIEILLYQMTGERFNFSDRFLGIVAGTKNPGNDPHVVAEAIRKYGLIPESMLPFSDDIQSIDEYYSFKGGDEAACRKAGQDWLAKYDFKHEWAFQPGMPVNDQLMNMRLALKNSPLCIAIYAWSADQRNVYIAEGQPNHWTTSYAIANYMNIFDTYDPFRKLLEQNVVFCKRYSIRVRNAADQKKIGILQSLLNSFLKLLGLYQEELNTLPKKPEPVPAPVVIPEPAPVVPVPSSDVLNKFCLAIQGHEGFYKGSRSKRNNNPGNCKFFAGGYDKKYGSVRSDNGGFAMFQTYALGFLYLENLVKLKAHKHPEWDFYQFFGDEHDGWAPASDNNDSKRYAFVVATHCGVQPETKVLPLLST